MRSSIDLLNTLVTGAAIGGVYKELLCKISQNSQENTCARVSFLIKLQALACNLIKTETLTQVLSHEFCKIIS